MRTTTRISLLTIMVGAVLMCLLLSGCATILGGGSSQGITLTAQPSHATYAIKSASGLLMSSGAAPAQVRLPRKNEYQIEIVADGFKPQSVVLTRGTNGWIWGNLVVGWIVGFGVDFLTGSAYKLEPAIVSVALQTAALDNGAMETYAVVRMEDEHGKCLEERHLALEPAEVHTGEISTPSLQP